MKVVLEFNYPDDEDNLKRFVQVVGNREWVGLTDKDMNEPRTHTFDFIAGARWAEALLKERNT